MANIPSINKFSFAQLTSNNDGKTSGSGTMGVLICTIGALGFTAGLVDKMFISHTQEILNESITYTLIGASLLGLRKVAAKNDPPSGTPVTNADSPVVEEPSADTPLNS